MSESPSNIGAQAVTKGGSTDLGLALLSAVRSSGGIAAATLFLFLLSWFVQPQSLSASALSGMLPFAAILAIVALGQTLVIQQGGIDLSVPGVISLSSVVVAYTSMSTGSVTLALLYAFVAALLSGVICGLLVSKVHVAPIVVTIGVNALLYGVNVSISGGTPVNMPVEVLSFVNSRIFGVSSLVFVALGVAAMVIFAMKATVAGRRFELVGANERAAYASGISTWYYKLAAYSAAAMLYCLAGILLGGLMQLPSAFQGDTYLMPSIAAAVLGGTSLFGGKGNLMATVIAALFLTQLQQLVLTTGASVGTQYLFQGAAIIVGVGVYSINLSVLKGGKCSVRRKASGG